MPRQALRSATNAFSREGFRTNSLSQNLTVLPAPSGREPLARPQTLHFSRELCRHAKGPILEGAVERSETGGVLLKKQNAQVPKNLCVMAGVVSFELTARGFGDRCSTS